MKRRTRTVLGVTITAAAALTLGAAPALATHVHGKVLPSGDCVLLAPNGGEKLVQLPDSEFGPTRAHPLHAKVHLGVPGQQARPGTIFVAIGDDGEYTAAAHELCGGEFLNG